MFFNQVWYGPYHMGIDLTNCHFETSGHAALILRSSIANHSAPSINAIYHLELQCAKSDSWKLLLSDKLRIFYSVSCKNSVWNFTTGNNKEINPVLTSSNGDPGMCCQKFRIFLILENAYFSYSKKAFRIRLLWNHGNIVTKFMENRTSSHVNIFRHLDIHWHSSLHNAPYYSH